MTLLHPVWLFLLLPLAVSVWRWPLPSRFLRVLRSVTLGLLVLALCGPAVKLPSRTGTVVVVADRSLSMPENAELAQKEAIHLIETKRGTDDRVAVVSFGQTAIVEHPPDGKAFGGFANQVGRDASNLADALETALALVPKDSPGRLMVLSDGRWTGRDPSAVAASVAARGVAVDYRILQRSAANDLAIARVDAPASVAPGESFMLTAWVYAPTAQRATVELKRGERTLRSEPCDLMAGLNRLTFADDAAAPGTQEYTLRVTGGGDDPIPENNTARLLVGVRGPRPLLCVSPTPKSGLAALLKAGKLPLKEATPDQCTWSLEELSKYSGVVLENVSAEQVGHAGMETLAAWVRETGAGLMMTGGKNSYGPGGYYKSPLEPVLPVSMELRNEHRKLAMAIVVVLDRSGSMAMPVAGGRQKMDLANLGTAQVLDLLSPMDEFGCIAVDTIPHTIAELSPVRDKEKVRKDILGIRSEGGGIYIYVALQAAAEMMLKAKAGTKHIILFADASDSEEPGRYKELVGKIRSAGISVSVIGLGTAKDVDAELLKDIAARGKGRVYFTDKAEELPRLFAQDTFVVARNTFLDEPVAVRTTPGLAALTGKSFAVTKPIGGYNLCYLRPEATLATVTLDEYKAPVVAAWQAGLGRVLCYTGDADGKYAGPFRAWKDVGDFYTSLARWTAGQAGPASDKFLVTQEVKNGINRVELHLDPERSADPFVGLPRVTTLRSVAGQGPEVGKAAMAWTGADTLAVEVSLQSQAAALTTVEVPGVGPVSLPPVCLPYSPEFKPGEGEGGPRALERLGRVTGGKERVDLPGIWHDLPKHPRWMALGHWLLLLVLVLIVTEVLERRTGLVTRPAVRLWRGSGRVAARLRRGPRPAVVAAAESAARPIAAAPTPTARSWPAATPAPEVVRPPAAPKPQVEAGGMVDALRKARERTRGRTETGG